MASRPTKAEIDSLTSLGSFDYLVVGAGPSASGLLKALLSQADATSSTKPTVAVLEKGGDLPSNRNLAQWATASQQDAPKFFGTIHGQRQASVVVASGLGGNTRVNAGLVVPPAPDDFDSLPYTTRDEAMKGVDAILNALPIQCNPSPSAAMPFDRGNAETNIPWNETKYPSVCTRVPCCVDTNGDRVTYFEALVPMESKQLEVFLHHTVERIEANNVLIVRHTQTDRLYRIHAKRDIILCAGSIETPALLVASGLLDAPTPIGDHQLLPKIYVHWPRWNSPSSGNGVTAISNFLLKSGSRIQVSIIEGGNLIDVVPHLVATITWFHAYPGDVLHGILLMLVQLLVGYTPLYFLFRYCTTVMTVFLMNADSEGTLQVIPKSKSAMYRSDFDVSIDLNYLSKASDFASYKEAWDCDFYVVDGIEIFPLAFSNVFARLFVSPYFHWMGTCRNIDKDWHLSSGQSKSLRICDASILPGLSAPTALTCASLGFVLGKRLREEMR